ncbi:hypothetical protein OCU04_009926 [Sclerotinia nivalis]|uniref:Berberine/berberine-like domain-containing protein n=1 Tax=Sclerotinia nivalis TaxID=352851 RepID=A0A9X0DGI6_9HELO|nr:hypothetical protein OCU04_009926 [Sclerotinia nivalis]
MRKTVHSIWKSSIPCISSISGINWAMTIQPLPMPTLSKSQGVNSLGLSASSGPLTLFLLSYNWGNIEDDGKVTEAAMKLISNIDEVAKEKGMGMGSEFKYLNYAAGWQNSIGGYGAENLGTLRRVSEKYDPDGLSQKLCEGGFKISKSWASGGSGLID